MLLEEKKKPAFKIAKALQLLVRSTLQRSKSRIQLQMKTTAF